MVVFDVVVCVVTQMTAYGVRISDWSSDVCSSALLAADLRILLRRHARQLVPLDDVRPVMPRLPGERPGRVPHQYRAHLVGGLVGQNVANLDTPLPRERLGQGLAVERGIELEQGDVAAHASISSSSSSVAWLW